MSFTVWVSLIWSSVIWASLIWASFYHILDHVLIYPGDAAHINVIENVNPEGIAVLEINKTLPLFGHFEIICGF